MSAQVQAHERRRFSRVPFEAAVTLSCPEGKWSATLIDISLKGVLVSRPHQWVCKEGEQMLVDIHAPGEAFRILMETVVAHAENETVGLQCNSIDLDSASHLHRLMELNIGDEDILNRELSMMGA